MGRRKSQLCRTTCASSANNMTKATAIVGVTCFLLLSATVFVALSDKDHSTTDIGSPSATTDLHVDKVKDAEADGPSEAARFDSFWDHTAGSGQCDKPQLDKIARSIKAAAPKIQYAIDNRNDALWTKWFGQPTSENPDYKVDDRMKDGLKRMDDRDWQPLCCPVSGGDEHCKSFTKTGSRTMAYVNLYRYNNTKYTWNRITLCADTFSETDMTFGFTLFHEAVHMISNAGDGNGGYSKKNLVSLALNKPDLARLTSNSYMLYTMQNSLSHDDYEKYSDGEGHSLTSLACTNKWHNCHDGLTATQCASGTLTNGQALGVDCCEACSQFNLSTTQSTSNPGNNQNARGLKRVGEDCWDGCNNQQGPCDWCGTGYCCRLGWSDHSNGCDGSIGMVVTDRSEPRHVCSKAPNGACADEKASGGEAWTDSAGSNCAFYKRMAEYSWCSSYGTSYTNAGLVANQACCTCGGGSK